MKYEYLIFNIVVVILPLISSVIICMSGKGIAGVTKKMLLHLILATVLTSIPFVIWDILATGKHWYFNEAYVTGFTIFTIPIEELLFFFTVPFASGTLYLVFFHRPQPKSWRPTNPFLRIRYVYPLAFLPLAGGIVMLIRGTGYTGYTLIALFLIMLFDAMLSQVLIQAPFYLFLVLCTALNLLFNGYLTWRPIVLYVEGQYLGWRIFSTPVEDFIYGAALFIVLINMLQALQFKKYKANSILVLTLLIKTKLQQYRVEVQSADPNLPYKIDTPPKVAVVGAGLAGISAAIILAERGCNVHLFEANQHIGGKCGSWKKTLEGGKSVTVDHGFHGIFPCYYNLLNFLLNENIILQNTRNIGRYTVVNRKKEIFHIDDNSNDGGEHYILYQDKDIPKIDRSKKTPLFNILAMRKDGFFTTKDLLFKPPHWKLMKLLQYNHKTTFKKYDDIPFSDFIEKEKINPNLKFLLTIFARVFFATSEKLSTAQVLKNFHFYFLSNDRGLLYEYVFPDYSEGFIQPLQSRMDALGVKVQKNRRIERIHYSLSEGQGMTQGATQNFQIEGIGDSNSSRFDTLILACNASAAKSIIDASPSLATALPTTSKQISNLPPSQFYCNYRIWVRCKFPFEQYSLFTSVERLQILDTITQVDAYDDDCRQWAEENEGQVLELHCYSIPDTLEDPQKIQQLLLEDLAYYFPQFNPSLIVHDDFQINNDFAPLMIGTHKHCPTPETELENFYFAGDWVRLPIPCCHLEAAHSSARFVANAILRKHGARQTSILSVPLKGLFAL